MRLAGLSLVACIAAAASIAPASAEEPRGAGERERPAAADRNGSSRDSGRREPEARPRDAILAALDADNNGEISAEEIEAAAAALKKLDQNRDGKLTAQEFLGSGGAREPGRGEPGRREERRPEPTRGERFPERGRPAAERPERPSAEAKRPTEARLPAVRVPERRGPSTEAAPKPEARVQRTKKSSAEKEASLRGAASRSVELAAAIDRLIAGKAGENLAPRSTDAEFMRRIYLDLAGTVPSVDEVRTFLADASPEKRTQLIDRLLLAPTYARRMQQAFDVILLQRRTGPDLPAAPWEAYLEESFAENEPWDQFVRGMIAADRADPATSPAINFLTARGEAKAQALDVGRLLLGRDYDCAQCHNHPTVSDYKQADFYGLAAYLNRSYLLDDGNLRRKVFAERDKDEELRYSSAFTGEAGIATPHLPGRKAVELPTAETKEKELGQEAAEGNPPMPKVTPRWLLAQELASSDNAEFARNAANRFWALMMGRGVVHPLDLHHSGNPPSHPELLDNLSEEFAASQCNVQAFLRGLALSETYQRSSLLREGAAPPVQSFAVANSKPLSAEQLVYSVLQATGNLERVLAASPTPGETAKYRPDKGQPLPAENMDSILKLFRSVYAAQPGEREEAFNPSLAGALFLSNETLILDWLRPQAGNLIDRLLKMPESGEIAEELYLSVLSRAPAENERADVAEYLANCSEGRETALREMAWALMASAEFRLNH